MPPFFYHADPREASSLEFVTLTSFAHWNIQKLLLQLSAGAELRKLLAEPARMNKLQSLCAPLTVLAKQSSENKLMLGNFLGLLTNVCLEPSALLSCQRRSFTEGSILPMFAQVPVVSMHIGHVQFCETATHSHKLDCMQILLRAATFACRLCTTESYANDQLDVGIFGKLMDFTPPSDMQEVKSLPESLACEF